MATLGNLSPEIPDFSRPLAPVIDILTGAAPAPRPATAPSHADAAVWEFDQAAWSVVRESQRFRERAYENFKRTLDAIGAAILLLALSPLFLAIALAITLTGRGPVFFRQERLGRCGQRFACLKFRTMVADAERRLANDPALRAAFEANYKIKNDPRVSAVGRLLRRTSLDELPQLWNVLRGEMSLIGPRPIVPPELSKYGLYGQKLLTVRPGVSGLWQTCGRSDTTYQQRVSFDMLYIDHRCVWLDCKLLLLTLVAVCRKAGAC